MASTSTPPCSSRRPAFTLLELMISVALGALILIMAFIAIRSASRAVRDVRRLATENDLLANGWFIVSNEADYWLSHASPEFPYLKQSASDAVPLGTVLPGLHPSYDNPWDKRPFRRVAWPADTGPSSLLPHDSRSWYRGSVLPGVIPCSRLPNSTQFSGKYGGFLPNGKWDAPAWSPTFLYLTGFDPTTNGISYDFTSSGSTSHTTTLGSTNFWMPAGWEPWHLHGDFATISNVTQTGTRPAIHWSVFKELGHLGTATYLPPGSPNLVVRPPTNRSVANIGNAAKWWDWGEIPWSLSYGNGADPAGYSPYSFIYPTAADLPDARRGNINFGNPGTNTGTSIVAQLRIDGYNGVFFTGWGNSQQVATFKQSAGLPYLLCDLDRPTRPYVSLLNASPVLETALLYPGRALFRPDTAAAGKVWDTDSFINGIVIDPLRALTSPNPKDLETTSKAYTSRTVHLPQNPTDAPQPDLSRLPPETPSLATSVLRLRTSGADHAFLTITVQHPETDVRIELPFTMVGTSYRGARQHWGWKSGYDDTRLPAMGDVTRP